MVSPSADNADYTPYAKFDRSSIQGEIDYWLSPEKWEQYSIAVKNLKGPCDLVRSIAIRFYNDTFTGFTALHGNNNLYFKNCIFEEYFKLVDGVVIFENCTFRTPPLFIACKVDFIKNNKFYATVSLDNKTFLKSNENEYHEPVVFSLAKNSRLESFKDTYYDSSLVYEASENCYIKSVAPVFNKLVGQIFKAKNNCCLFISDTKIIQLGPPLFDIEDSCNLQVFNLEKIAVSDLVLKQSNKCKATFKNIPLIVSENEIYSCGNSDLVALNIKKSEAKNNFFNSAGGGNYLFKYFELIKADNIGFNIQGGNFRILGKEEAFILTNKEVILSSGKYGTDILVSNLDRLESLQEACINTENTYTNLSEIKKIQGKKQGIVAFNTSYVKANNVDDILGQTLEGIKIYNDSEAICSNIKNITGQTYGLAGENSSHFICNTVNSIKGNTDDGISVQNYSSAKLGNVQSVNGKTVGVSAYVNSDIYIKDTPTISSANIGIHLYKSDLFYQTKNGNITGSSVGLGAETDVTGINKIKIIGPVTIKGSSAFVSTKYVVDDLLVTWDGEVTVDQTTLDSKFPSGKNINLSDSYIKTVSAKLSKINPVNSSVNLHKTSFSTLYQKESTVFGSQVTGNLNFNKQSNNTSAKAFFATEKDLVLQADDNIYVKTDIGYMTFNKMLNVIVHNGPNDTGIISSTFTVTPESILLLSKAVITQQLGAGGD